jgi:hypothetical protein
MFGITNKKHGIPQVKIELVISLYTPNKSYQICVLDQFCDRKFIWTFELKIIYYFTTPSYIIFTEILTKKALRARVIFLKFKIINYILSTNIKRNVRIESTSKAN